MTVERSNVILIVFDVKLLDSFLVDLLKIVCFNIPWRFDSNKKGGNIILFRKKFAS